MAWCQVEAAWQRFGANGKLPPGPVKVSRYCCFMGISMDFTGFIYWVSMDFRWILLGFYGFQLSKS
jgi:hypothetical protein